MNISGNTYYVNPNNWTLTTNLKDTEISDNSTFRAMSMQLRPVDDMEKVLSTPIKLAGKTYLDKAGNSVSLSDNAKIRVNDGFILTVTQNGVTVSGGNPNNDSAMQEAQDMAGALSKLLRNAGGTLKNLTASPSSYNKWSENISNVMRYIGIDTSKDFYVNDMRYTKDTNGNYISNETQRFKDAYEKLNTSIKAYMSSPVE